jgi:hypothetical protein
VTPHFSIAEMLLFGLVVTLLPFASSSYHVNGKWFWHRYIYTGYSYSPRFPSGASWEAEIVRSYVRGKEVYILYDNNYIFDFDWKEF